MRRRQRRKIQRISKVRPAQPVDQGLHRRVRRRRAAGHLIDQRAGPLQQIMIEKDLQIRRRQVCNGPGRGLQHFRRRLEQFGCCLVSQPSWTSRCIQNDGIVPPWVPLHRHRIAFIPFQRDVLHQIQNRQRPGRHIIHKNFLLYQPATRPRVPLHGLANLYQPSTGYKRPD